ncbi:MAG: TetR/AcrR family transcriptional regulator [FCB group bacterium]|nr:TetR/AcrR family transcriptional regulator [FCB group bacterium]
MDKLARKKRELLQREGLFLDIARRLLLKEGYHGLTMARVAQAAEYSKGTIYQHFSCKEEVILTLVTRSLERRLAMLEKAAAFRANPRERIVALGEAMELFVRLYPDDLRLIFLSNTEAITQKASEQFVWNMRRCAHRSFGLVTGIVRDGIARGDLTLPVSATPEHIAFGLRALTDGAYAITMSWIPPREVGIAQPIEAAKDICQILCDGYGWRPLSTEWDYNATRRRVWDEVFPGEVKKIASN